jgi:two-component system response regulator AtoC
MSNILIIDDDDFIRGVLKSVLKKAGYKVFDAAEGETGLKYVKQFDPDLVLTDYKMPGLSGMDVLQEIVRTHPGLPVIMLTAYGDVALTIKAIQAGAYDFIEKPVKNHELLEAIQNGVKASEQSKSLKQVIAPEARKEIEENLPAGKTPAMREIFKNIGRISLNKVNVVITGESGTGKEQVARLIHYSGINREHPFMVVYCSSADEQKLERELFGYANGNESGNFAGKLEQVGEGTIFIDEFPELPDRIQRKLFRAFQNGEFEKPGNPNPIQLKARFIVATHKDVDAILSEGSFSKDLYYRFSMFSIHLPPVRERKEDIPELVQSLLLKLNRRFNKHVVKVEEGLIDLLKSYSWPGNIRELENTLTQAMILTHGDVLEKKNIPAFQKSGGQAEDVGRANLVPMSEIEKEHIKKVLDAVNWNKMEASGILQITRPTLNKKIEKYTLEPNSGS